MNNANTINEYIAGFPEDVQKKLQQIREAITAVAPQAIEKISYGMPTFYLNGNLVHFAGYKNHIGFYPAPSGLKAFAEEVGAYKNSKGAVQFPVDKPLPISLVKKITKYRLHENMMKPVKKTAKA